MFAFFYEESDVLHAKILRQLENLDDQLEESGVPFVKISRFEEDEFDLSDLPAIVYFSQGAQTSFSGEIRQIESVSHWIDKCLKDDKKVKK